MPLGNLRQALEVPDLFDVDAEFVPRHADQRQLARVRQVEVQAVAHQVGLAAWTDVEGDLGRGNVQVAAKDQAQGTVTNLVTTLMVRETIPPDPIVLSGRQQRHKLLWITRQWHGPDMHLGSSQRLRTWTRRRERSVQRKIVHAGIRQPTSRPDGRHDGVHGSLANRQ
jgi:hypothetical protein